MTQSTLPSKHLIIVGAVHVDDIAQPLDALVPRASNPVKWSTRVGGVAANAACSAARLPLSATLDSINFLAAVGDDSVATLLEQALQNEGINTHLQIFENCNTGKYTAVMSHDGELYIGLADVALAEKLGQNGSLDIPHLDSAAAILFDANISQTCAEDLLAQALTHKTPVAAMSVSPVKTKRLIPLAKQIKLLFCNRREALSMIPDVKHDAPLLHLADGLNKIGFKSFVLTDGSADLIIQDDTSRSTLSIANISIAASVNGAGDALAGATFAAWATGTKLNDAVAYFGLEQAKRIIQGRHKSPLVNGNAAD